MRLSIVRAPWSRRDGASVPFDGHSVPARSLQALGDVELAYCDLPDNEERLVALGICGTLPTFFLETIGTGAVHVASAAESGSFARVAAAAARLTGRRPGGDADTDMADAFQPSFVGEKGGRLDEVRARVAALPADGRTRVFVAGDASGAGKSSLALGLVAALARAGVPPADLAYIKPATQNEKPQPVTRWCDANGVAAVGAGPLVFYKVRGPRPCHEC